MNIFKKSPFVHNSKWLVLAIIVYFVFIATKTFANQNIEVVGGSTTIPKIIIFSFVNENNTDKNISEIIKNDLNITGEINAIKSTVPQNQNSDNIPQYIISGKIINGTVSYKLVKGVNTLINQQIKVPNNIGFRYATHMISNQIYEKITHTKGVFTSKIAYITKNKQQYQLIVADYDGFNQKLIITSNSPIISLSWSPNDQQICYTSFESGKPVVYVQNIYEGNRYIVANFKGSNSSPSFTPDGKKLAVALSKDYGSHIYLVDNKPFTPNTKATDLIIFGEIDTEANIKKDNQIIFTSNHDGGPQIFMSTTTSMAKPERLSINLGNYNTSAKFAHNTNKITFVSRDAGTLKAYIMDLTTEPYTSYPINLGTMADIAPSFSPNDKLVLFSSDQAMYIVNANGTIETKLSNINAKQIIDQSWSNN